MLREAIDTWRISYDADDLHYPTMPDMLTAALMADPDLLVDLAIEAGVLEPWGAWLTAARCNHDAREWCDIKDHTETPLYRRPSRPTGEDRP